VFVVEAQQVEQRHRTHPEVVGEDRDPLRVQPSLVRAVPVEPRGPPLDVPRPEEDPPQVPGAR
jgi:hypothetical protein